MQRRPSTQDISWILDLDRNKQLDLSPPYQRKSVWTKKDQQFFLDTIFRNYPSPAIFLHKTISGDGQTVYHVVDGKQRIQTILSFVNNKVRVASDYGDARLNNKRWSDLNAETETKRSFWNYQITVEIIDFADSSLINNVFDRLNRNARRLTQQELRHAKYDGWFVTEAEQEAAREEWRTLKVVTSARSKRMADVQFMSELMLVNIYEAVQGFDHDALEQAYADFDDPFAEDAEPLDVESFQKRFAAIRAILVAMDNINSSVSESARALGNIYSLWSVLSLAAPSLDDLPSHELLAKRFADFMSQVDVIASQTNLPEFLKDSEGKFDQAFQYYEALRAASTELPQRNKRHEVLSSILLQPQ
jgi:Uncharacterized conserved protein